MLWINQKKVLTNFTKGLYWYYFKESDTGPDSPKRNHHIQVPRLFLAFVKGIFALFPAKKRRGDKNHNIICDPES